MPYRTLKALSKHKDLAPLVSEVHTSAANYTAKINQQGRLAKHFRFGRATAKAMANVDRSRTISHNAFMSSISAVARKAQAKKIPVHKLVDVAGDRLKGTNLALRIAPLKK